MQVEIKVAGTTFHPIPAGKKIQITSEFSMGGGSTDAFPPASDANGMTVAATGGNVPCASAPGILMPEPTNEYDSEAVAVYIPLTDGTAFHIGYIPKASPVKTQIKVPTQAVITIKDYSQVGNLNPSFVITSIG